MVATWGSVWGSGRHPLSPAHLLPVFRHKVPDTDQQTPGVPGVLPSLQRRQPPVPSPPRVLPVFCQKPRLCPVAGLEASPLLALSAGASLRGSASACLSPGQEGVVAAQAERVGTSREKRLASPRKWTGVGRRRGRCPLACSRLSSHLSGPPPRAAAAGGHLPTSGCCRLENQLKGPCAPPSP